MASAESAEKVVGGATTRPKSLWRNRDFVLLWSGQAVSSVGSQVSQLAFPLLVLAVTQSPALAGLVGAVRVVPFLALCLPAGALVDRWNRKRVMIFCDAGRALAMGSIPLFYALGRLSIVQLFVASIVEGTLYTFFNLAETAALTRVVPKEQLTAATARNETLLSTAVTLGPLLSGVLYSAGRALPFLADTISYFASVVSLRYIRAEFQTERAEPAAGNIVAEIREGMRWLWNHRLMRFLAVFVGGGMLVENAYILVVIVLLQTMPGSPFSPSVTTGLVLAAGGVGSIAGSIASERVAARFNLRQIALAVHWIWVMLLPLYVLARSPWALAAITSVAYGITPIFFAAQYSYRLAVIPDALIGRVNSVFRMVMYAGQPIGLALAGALLQWVHADATIFVLTGILLALCLAATFNAHLRRAPALTSV